MYKLLARIIRHFPINCIVSILLWDIRHGKGKLEATYRRLVGF